ncbi:MAG: hypothetical protein HYX92_14185 [Chloroflexi bacterium]|nr:hypothetical protein [Chloroflexota bacterium]
MGTWETDIMGNDLAQDVKIAFEGALEDRRSISGAVKVVKEQYRESLDDPDAYPDFVLALGWLAGARGKLDETLKEEAGRVIREGLSLRKWQDVPEYEERRQKEQQFLEVLEGKAPHPEPYKRRRRVRLKIGDVFEIPLSDERKAFGQYVFLDPKTGYLVQIFNLISRETPSVDAILKSGPKFPPVFTGPGVAVEEGWWRVIGHAEVKGFKYPVFRSGNYDKEGRVAAWWLYDGKVDVKVGKLPPGAEKYEFLVIWSPQDVARRIETGENFYDTLR